MKKLAVVLCIFCTFLCSLSYAWSPEQRERITSRTYPVAYDRLLDVAVQTFEGGGFPIKKIDRQNGIIETGIKSQGGPFGSASAQIFARLEKMDPSNTRIVLSLHQQTKVQLGLLSPDQLNYGDECIDEGAYKRTFAGIEKRLKK